LYTRAPISYRVKIKSQIAVSYRFPNQIRVFAALLGDPGDRPGVGGGMPGSNDSGLVEEGVRRWRQHTRARVTR